MSKIFKNNPELQKYFQTSDGVKFYRKDYAESHARSLKNKTVEIVERPHKEVPAVEETEEDETPVVTLPEKEDPAPEDDAKKLTPMQLAKQRVDAINEMLTVEDVNKALEGESAKSVLKAGAERIAAIKANDALNSDDENENIQTK